MFNRGDIVIGLPTASRRYAETVEGTKWLVKEVDEMFIHVVNEDGTTPKGAYDGHYRVDSAYFKLFKRTRLKAYHPEWL